MKHLCYTLASMEEALIALERRGINLRTHAERADLETGKLPVIHVFLGRREHWFRGRVTLEQFLKEQEARSWRRAVGGRCECRAGRRSRVTRVPTGPAAAAHYRAA